MKAIVRKVLGDRFKVCSRQVNPTPTMQVRKPKIETDSEKEPDRHLIELAACLGRYKDGSAEPNLVRGADSTKKTLKGRAKPTAQSADLRKRGNIGNFGEVLKSVFDKCIAAALPRDCIEKSVPR